MFWRVVLNKVLTFKEASEGTPEDLINANAALDIKIEIEKKKIEEAKRNGGKD